MAEYGLPLVVAGHMIVAPVIVGDGGSSVKNDVSGVSCGDSKSEVGSAFQCSSGKWAISSFGVSDDAGNLRGPDLIGVDPLNRILTSSNPKSVGNRYRGDCTDEGVDIQGSAFPVGELRGGDGDGKAKKKECGDIK
ncbi:hypothetical protein R6Q57_022671 [Mikania cordata]